MRRRPSKGRSIEPPDTPYGQRVTDGHDEAGAHESLETPEFEAGEQEGKKELRASRRKRRKK